jgi:tetratricopeptide (TPR) repeat protein
VPRRLAVLLLAATAVLSAPVVRGAEDEVPDASAQYEDCLLQIEAAPDEAYERAMSWAALDGGAPAEHCAAVALIALGQYHEAGKRLEALANRLARSGQADLSLDALAQAGNAWQLAGELERAYAVQTTALEKAPNNADLLVDRAVTLAAAANYGDARADLDRALALAPGRPDALIYRASARRFLGDMSGALEDVEQALTLDPDNPEGLLERGILRRLANDLDGARSDWQRAATLAEGQPTGDAAQANIAKLELGQD